MECPQHAIPFLIQPEKGNTHQWRCLRIESSLQVLPHICIHMRLLLRWIKMTYVRYMHGHFHLLMYTLHGYLKSVVVECSPEDTVLPGQQLPAPDKYFGRNIAQFTGILLDINIPSHLIQAVEQHPFLYTA